MYIKHQKTYGIPKPSQTCSPESVLYLNDVTPVSWICLRIQPSHTQSLFDFSQKIKLCLWL
jgi:hypothetical protein